MKIAATILSTLALGVVVVPAAKADYTVEEIAQGVEQCKQSFPANRIEAGNCELLRRLDIEQRLNRTYQKVIASLRERDEQKSIDHLRKAQRAWVKFREASCEVDVNDGSPPFDPECMANIAEDRILYLEGQLSGFCATQCAEGYKIPACKICDS